MIIAKETKEEYLSFLAEDNRDTKRKKKITLNHDIKETEYIIEHVQKGINRDGSAWYLGQKYYPRNLRALKHNLQLYKDILKSL